MERATIAVRVGGETLGRSPSERPRRGSALGLIALSVCLIFLNLASSRAATIDAKLTDMASMTGRCPEHPPFAMSSDQPAWNGSGDGPANARVQSAAVAGLSAADAPRLKLKWAFGLPPGANSFSQPTIAGGWLFVGSDNATLYALDAKTGCGHWSFHSESPGRAAPVVAPIQARGFAVFFASTRGVLRCGRQRRPPDLEDRA